jgi:hypothetical protein
MVPSIAQLQEDSNPVEGFYGQLKSVDSKLKLEKVIREHELVPLWNTGTFLVRPLVGKSYSDRRQVLPQQHLYLIANTSQQSGNMRRRKVFSSGQPI